MLRSLKSINQFFFILSATILLTIGLAWVLYPMEIHWLGIQSRTGFSASVIMKNFNVLMNYLTNPFQWVFEDAQFPSSKMACTIRSRQVPVSFGDGRFLGHSTWFYPVYADSRQKWLPGPVP